jgi:uncharacterized protein
VRLAYLFGSRAQGRWRPDSDIDVAVLVDAETAAADRGAVVRRLAARLGHDVSSALLDLVILNDAPALLRHRVVRDGVLLLQRSPVDRVRFVTRMLRDYQDGQIRREWATRRRIQRLKAGVTDGGSRDLLEKARGVARLLGKAPGIS